MHTCIQSAQDKTYIRGMRTLSGVLNENPESKRIALLFGREDAGMYVCMYACMYGELHLSM